MFLRLATVVDVLKPFCRKSGISGFSPKHKQHTLFHFSGPTTSPRLGSRTSADFLRVFLRTWGSRRSRPLRPPRSTRPCRPNRTSTRRRRHVWGVTMQSFRSQVSCTLWLAQWSALHFVGSHTVPQCWKQWIICLNAIISTAWCCL